MGTLSREQIEQLGFASVGSDVLISDKCSIYGAAAISIGNHVRIDDYSILTAKEAFTIGSHVHVSAYAFLGGTYGITIEDFVNISIRGTLLSGEDDVTGQWLMGPSVPADLRNVRSGRIHLREQSAVGMSSIVLPGVELGRGALIGAFSLVKTSLSPWGIYVGVPARLISSRERRVEDLARGLTHRMA